MTHSFLAQAADSVSYWPLGILAISVIFIVFSIIKLKLHPFLALIFAAVLTGLLTGDLPGMSTENVGLFKSRVALNDTPEDTSNDMLLALKWSLLGFGNTAAGIGFVVALAAIIGTCMLGSGAADRVVRALMNLCGEKRAGFVLLLSGFLLSIPVFFDTVFFLLIPLARALSLRTGKSYTLYVIAMAGAGAITHSMVPPTPGPLMIAAGLQLDLGVAMMAGLLASILPAFLVLYMARCFDAKFNIPMRETPGTSNSELKSIVDKKNSELPNLFLSALPIAIPVVLISLVSILKLVGTTSQATNQIIAIIGWVLMLVGGIGALLYCIILLVENFKESVGWGIASLLIGIPLLVFCIMKFEKVKKPFLRYWLFFGLLIIGAGVISGGFRYLEFFGDPNIAMLLAAIVAIFTLATQMIRESRILQEGVMATLAKALEDPLQIAGIIILITGAGGAFGGMIRLAGVGETIEALANSYNISLVLLAWGATAVVRIAQGSATVSMITGVGLMGAVIGDGSGLDYHPFYIFLAIGFGSITLSWMNDSGFWVVQRLSGFTEKETLKTWSVLLTAISLLGLVQTLVFSKILPLKPETKNVETAVLILEQK
jgi:H+/gluconate symporter-like permease